MKIRTGDPKEEKHVPSIEVREVEGGLEIEVEVGKYVKHPNTREHHISWIEVYFKGEGPEKLLARAEFFGGEVRPEPKLKIRIGNLGKGKVIALSYCNLHGLWYSELEI